MNLSLPKLEKFGFNHRALTDQDFYEICEKEQINIIELDVPTSFYFCVRGRSFIVLKKKLRGLRKTFAAFHELAHHFLHGGTRAENAFFLGLLQNKEEFEADALATIALIPLAEIGKYEFLEYHPNHFARKIFNDRQKLFFLYNV